MPLELGRWKKLESGAHTIFVRAKGPHGKYSDGSPKVFGYTVKRVMVDVSPW